MGIAGPWMVEVVQQGGDDDRQKLNLAEPLDLAKLGQEQVHRERDVGAMD
eukprot:CAMPEP_0182797970 /NCGR_PEP_ID=MMETSP0006_2-20121128/1103_1 /TAXON_ID=97485 /ORGANISM="Prymnesium parvum, Strain Texoma1" /LENGTH=49 /DNA_ID=CAMNT_0024923061 /DNA_START=1140 /DNA_END=1289 /DNA_ORIENTATION=+